MSNEINKDEVENLKKEVERLVKRTSTLKKENKVLAERLEKSHNLLVKCINDNNTSLRKDLDRLLDGTEENPGILKAIQELTKRFPNSEKD